jgi:hypothetical protein
MGICRVRNCREDARGGSSYCQKHICMEDGCTNKAQAPSNYCSKHREQRAQRRKTKKRAIKKRRAR